MVFILDPEVAKVWSLSANDLLDENVELIDDDTLLDEEDLKKPDPSSLKGLDNLFPMSSSEPSHTMVLDQVLHCS